MKKVIIWLLLILCLVGCGKNETNTVNDNELSGIEKTDDEQRDEIINEDLQTEVQPNKIVLPQNVTEETINGMWNNESLAKVFTSVGNKMYFCQWEKDGKEAALYQMEIGQDSLQEVGMDIPEGMNIYAMTSDVYNNLHILIRTKVSSSDEVTSIIRTIDSNGNFVKDLDISAAIGGEISLHQAFLADSKGNFYITGLWDTMGIDSEGNKLWMLENRALGIGDSYTAFLSTDDELYLPYQKNDATYLGKVDILSGDLVEEYSMAAMDGNDRILAMGQDENGTVLLYSSASGIWKWNCKENSLNNTVEMSESNLAGNEYILIRAFLADGRLFLTKNIDDNGRVYQYIPIQK